MFTRSRIFFERKSLNCDQTFSFRGQVGKSPHIKLQAIRTSSSRDKVFTRPGKITHSVIYVTYVPSFKLNFISI